jgi:glyoxylase I family protein
MAFPRFDHVGLAPADFEESLRFYRDGLGLEVLFDVVIPFDLEPLLGFTTTDARTLFLGNPDDDVSSSVELLGVTPSDVDKQPPVPEGIRRGLYLISFVLPVQDTLDRLASLGLGGEPHVMRPPSGNLSATVRDPDGVVVEILDRPVSFRKS